MHSMVPPPKSLMHPLVILSGYSEGAIGWWASCSARPAPAGISSPHLYNGEPEPSATFHFNQLGAAQPILIGEIGLLKS